MSWSWEVIMYKAISKIASRDSLSLGIHVLTWSPFWVWAGFILFLLMNEYSNSDVCHVKLGYKKTVTSDTPPSVSVSLCITYVKGSKLPQCEQTYAPKEWWGTEGLCTTACEEMKPANTNHRVSSEVDLSAPVEPWDVSRPGWHLSSNLKKDLELEAPS